MMTEAVQHEGEVIGHVWLRRAPINEAFTAQVWIAYTADGRRVLATTREGAVAWLMEQHVKAAA